MSNDGLIGKKFIGKIVKGQDDLQRGMYYVHIPELQPHMAETKGLICTNSIHSTRITNSERGSYGSYTPLHVGTVVQVECLTDDTSSLRITAIVSDDQPNSDMSPGKTMNVEPSGKVVQVAIDGGDEPVLAKDVNSIQSKLPTNTIGEINNLINQGGEFAQNLLTQVSDLLGNAFNSIKNSFTQIGNAIPKTLTRDELPSNLKISAFDENKIREKFQEIQKQSESLVDNINLNNLRNSSDINGVAPNSSSVNRINVQTYLGNIQNPEEYQKTLKDLKLTLAENQVSKELNIPTDKLSNEQIQTYLTQNPDFSKAIDTKVGVLNENKYISQEKEQWGKENANKISNVFTNTENPGQPNYAYGEGTKKPNLAERDEQYAVITTPNNSGMYINEKTQNDPNSLFIVYSGKDSVIRINSDGIHISTNHNFYQKISVNNDLVIDGSSSISVNGGNYDIFINGKGNIYSTGDFNITSEGSINLVAQKSINSMSGQETTFQANKITVSSDNNVEINAKSDMKLKSSSNFSIQSDSEFAVSGNSKVSLKSGGIVAADGSSVYLNSGQSSDVNISIQTNPVQMASPAKRGVCKI